MELFIFPFKSMGCPCELRIYAGQKHQAQLAAKACMDEAARFEQKYSRYLDSSAATEINRSAGIKPVEIDAETYAILKYAGVCYEQSNGLFDISSGVLRHVWHAQRGELPSEDEILRHLNLVGWEKVELSDQNIFLPISGMELDFGGIVKEYAADAIAALARTMSIRHGLVNLGGDISIIGPQMNNRPWPIGIVHPTIADTAISVIHLANGALATSGGYERYVEIAGKRYSHLINPQTGWPVESLLSVSVVAEQAVVAGSVSSIALLQGEQLGLNWLSTIGLKYLAIDADLHCNGAVGRDSFSSGSPVAHE